MSPGGPDVKAIFTAALELPAGPGRDAYLTEACGGDGALRRRVEELLAALERASDVLGPAGRPADATEVDSPAATKAPEPARQADPDATGARTHATAAHLTADYAPTPDPGDPGATASLDDRGDGRAAAVIADPVDTDHFRGAGR